MRNAVVVMGLLLLTSAAAMAAQTGNATPPASHGKQIHDQRKQELDALRAKKLNDLKAVDANSSLKSSDRAAQKKQIRDTYRDQRKAIIDKYRTQFQQH